jgi:hypothetical protein
VRHKKEEVKKMKWMGLLFLALALFLIALSTKVYALNIFVIGLSLYIYDKGDRILFKEYNEYRNRKIEDVEVVREATITTLQSKKLFKMKEE